MLDRQLGDVGLCAELWRTPGTVRRGPAHPGDERGAAVASSNGSIAAATDVCGVHGTICRRAGGAGCDGLMHQTSCHCRRRNLMPRFHGA